MNKLVGKIEIELDQLKGASKKEIIKYINFELDELKKDLFSKITEILEI